MTQFATKIVGVDSRLIIMLSTIWSLKERKKNSGEVKVSQEMISSRLQSQMGKHQRKLICRISQNMSDDLQKHIEAHRLREKMKYNSNSTLPIKLPFKTFSE